MAWRDARARATLIREAAGSMQPGKTPRAFAELLFDHTNIEDLVNTMPLPWPSWQNRPGNMCSNARPAVPISALSIR